MKRYRVDRVLREEYPVLSQLREDENGEWVRLEDAKTDNAEYDRMCLAVLAAEKLWDRASALAGERGVEVERLRAELALERLMSKGLISGLVKEREQLEAQCEALYDNSEAETSLAAANALLGDLATFALSRLDYHKLIPSDRKLFDELQDRLTAQRLHAHTAAQPATAPTTTYGNPPRCIVCDVDEGEHRPGCPHGPAKPAVAHDPRPPCPCGDQTHPGHPLGWCRPL